MNKLNSHLLQIDMSQNAQVLQDRLESSCGRIKR